MPAAENSASQQACAATSASESPARARSPGQASPASISGRCTSSAGGTATYGCTSTPTPIRGWASMVVLSSGCGCGSGPASAGQNLVEDGLGLVLVGLLGEGELGDQDLPGLGQHPLLTGGQPAVVLAAPQVTDDLGHLDDVARGELLQVGLVPARPVGRLLGVRR